MTHDRVEGLEIEVQRLRRALENIANWKEFYDRQPWPGPGRIGQYARHVLDGDTAQITAHDPPEPAQ